MHVVLLIKSRIRLNGSFQLHCTIAMSRVVCTI